MAIDYDGTPNGVFVQVGSVVKHYDLQGADGAGLDAELSDLIDPFEDMTAGAHEEIVDGVASSFVTWRGQYGSRRATLASLATRRLQDQETILDELALSTNTISAVVAALIRRMNDDTETILRSVVTIGAVTASASNEGNGTVLTTKILDGYSSPGAGAAGTYAANVEYAGVDSELAISESHAIICTADSFSDSTGEGEERFSWNGGVRKSHHSVEAEGSGSMTNPLPAHSNSLQLLANADFEDWTGDAPDDFTAIGTTFGAAAVKDQTAANVYHGDSSLKLTGDGAIAELGFSQALDVASLDGRRLYCVTFRLKASATIAAGDLVVALEGTDYTAGATEDVTIAAADLPTSFALQSFFVLLPADIPADLALVARWSGTPTSAKSLWFDDLSMSPVQYGGGIGVSIIRGNLPFVRGDRFDWTTTNDDAGKMQRFFRRAYGVQLPSSGTPTIADALAT